MASHGHDDDFDVVDADGWNQYDSYAMRRAPQQPAIHMTQQMTRPVSLLSRTQFLVGVTLHSWNRKNVTVSQLQASSDTCSGM